MIDFQSYELYNKLIGFFIVERSIMDLNYKALINEVDEEIKDIEYNINNFTATLDELHEILRDFNVKVIDYKLTQQKIENTITSRNKYIARLSEALKIKHIIEKYKE